MVDPFLRLLIKFDKRNYKERQLYKPLLRDFEFRTRGLKSSQVYLSGPDGKDRVLDPVEYFNEETLPFCRKFPKPIQSFVLAKNLDRVIYYNALPVAFRDAAAPEFFAAYPDGEIWYVRQSKKYLSKLWKMEWDVGKKVRPGIKPNVPGGLGCPAIRGSRCGKSPISRIALVQYALLSQHSFRHQSSITRLFFVLSSSDTQLSRTGRQTEFTRPYALTPRSCLWRLAKSNGFAQIAGTP